MVYLPRFWSKNRWVFSFFSNKKKTVQSVQYFFFTKICFVKGESRKTYRGGEHFGRRRTWNLVPYNSARRRFPNLPHVIPYLQRSHSRSPIREHEYAPVRSVAVNWPVMSVHRHPCLSGVWYCTRTPVVVRLWTWLMFARISLIRSAFPYGWWREE